jgi:GDP-D-mannose dehydratase
MHAQARAGRLKAASTCRERGWNVGTWLRSTRWNKDRRLTRIGKHTETVFFKDVNGNHYDTTSLPPDVREIDAPRPRSAKPVVFLIAHFYADYAYRNQSDSYYMKEIFGIALNRPAAERVREQHRFTGMAMENNEVRIIEWEAAQ